MGRAAGLLFPAVLAAQAGLSQWQALGSRAETRHEGCRGAFCTVLLPADATAAPGKFGSLVETLDAAPWRGRRIGLSAWIRVENSAPGHAQLFLRVLRPGGQMGFYDDMGDRPIVSTEWRQYEIAGEAAEDAESVQIGVLSFGGAHVWIDAWQVSPGAGPSPAEIAARREIESLYARIDAAYAAGNLVDMARLALPDAQLVIGQSRSPLSRAVDEIAAQLRRGAKIQSRSTVTSLRIADGSAIVSVNNDSLMSDASGAREMLSIDRDSWTRAPDGWKLRETILISSRPVTPRTDAATTRAVARELRQRAQALDENAPDSPGLAAFGSAIGEARLVALGEATHGTREFYTLNQRLFEYLVRHKGFTVLAIEANWPEALAVDRYIKTGQGDPRQALAGMNFWTWYTEEMLNLVEWMRAYNQAAGPHPILTFTSFDMQSGRAAAAKALDYLKDYAPDLADPAEAAFAAAYDVEIAGESGDGRAEPVAARVAALAHEMDTRHRELTAASGEEKWRDARQAAAVVLEACTFRVAGMGGPYREEAMAGNIEWIAGSGFPREKIVLWAHNAHVRAAAEPASMGAFLRRRFGSQIYIAGYAFRRGGLRAKGPRGGTAADVTVFDAPPSPEGSGDAVLSAAGLPMFFLDFARVPAETALGRWLAAPHLFHRVGSSWFAGDPDANFEPGIPRQEYDGLIFVEQGHAARPL